MAGSFDSGTITSVSYMTTYTTSGDDTWVTIDSGSTTSDGIWDSYTTSGTTTGSVTYTYQPVIYDNSPLPAGNPAPNYERATYEPPPETEEQREAREELTRRLREERLVKEQEREDARCKAEKLLRESLDEEQLAQFDETRWFYVISQSGKRYRIRCGWEGNIDELDEDDLIVAEWCIHPRIQVPTEDSMLIQKLMLEADEARFWEIANKRELREPQPVAV
jgi:hypothetical protein